MALAYEKNVDLGFDTDALRTYGERYGKIATDLRTLSSELDKCLKELIESGWTTPAGKEFEKMVNTNWSKNIEKYASLLETLKSILTEAANKYDTLVEENIEKTKL